ncbi:MAG: Nitrilase/cyanide hydratase and apolipoprotein N-acyltransferase [Clostridia bacterium]|nr:Nitrilase/cyanide hydratase and apolipoprotein N-acyltransferase [Clostridia bacterium]
MLETKKNNRLRIALLHIAPKGGEVSSNRSQIRSALAIAAGYEADLAVGPELAESGYTFFNTIDAHSIPVFPNEFICDLKQVARTYNMNLMIGFPERDLRTQRLYNALVYIDQHGYIQGTYRKIHVNTAKDMAWESCGSYGVVKEIQGIAAGFLLGEDLCYKDVAYQNQKMGAKILLAGTAWPEVEWDVTKEWQERSTETGLPLIVCNRTGLDGSIDFSQSTSMIIMPRQNAYRFSRVSPSVLIIDFDKSCNHFWVVGCMDL